MQLLVLAYLDRGGSGHVKCTSYLILPTNASSYPVETPGELKGDGAEEGAGRPKAVLSLVTNALTPATATDRMSWGRAPKLANAVDWALFCIGHDNEMKAIYSNLYHLSV